MFVKVMKKDWDGEKEIFLDFKKYQKLQTLEENGLTLAYKIKDTNHAWRALTSN